MKEYYAVYIEDCVNFNPNFPVAMFLISEQEYGQEWKAAYEYGIRFGVGKVVIRVKKFKVI